ncbi:GntR family transcriptional regulator [Micromonospora sp. RTGN7]|uniref:GntR family transcriptional regulator n=1 Tax=Micromonospora sp. RTGN7 TaxID=3016526 RepID=UPI0029FF37FE|nr:GntR family transcriptional regulator [Micromonospora sp. RTGN7]
MATPSAPLNRSDSLHVQVARNIRNDIESGVLRDGAVLPSTRELAAQWNVSVFTISEAMKVLARDGLVESKSRSKRVVRAPGQSRVTEVRLRKPNVVLVGGYPGSGKTELGRILARETGWPMLDKDTLTRPVVEAALEFIGHSPNDRESSDYLSKIRPREYEALAAATRENVMCGNSVIVTAPFIREFNNAAWIGRSEASYADMGARTVLVWLYCDKEVMHTYVRRRGAARDAAKLADWPNYIADIDTEFRPLAAHHLIDNCASGLPLQQQAKELLAQLLDGEERK